MEILAVMGGKTLFIFTKIARFITKHDWHTSANRISLARLMADQFMIYAIIGQGAARQGANQHFKKPRVNFIICRRVSVVHHCLRFRHAMPFPSWQLIDQRVLPLNRLLKAPVFRQLQTDRSLIMSPIADGYPSFQFASSRSQNPSYRNSVSSL